MTQKRFDRLIIHAGMLKTGSTTIQAALFNSKMRDATYLDLDMQNQSVACRLMWGDGLTSEMFHRVNGLNQERARFEVELPLPSGMLRLRAQVMLTNVAGNLKRENLPRGMGVHFLEISPDEKAALERYVDEQEARYRP